MLLSMLCYLLPACRSYLTPSNIRQSCYSASSLAWLITICNLDPSALNLQVIGLKPLHTVCSPSMEYDDSCMYQSIIGHLLFYSVRGTQIHRITRPVQLQSCDHVPRLCAFLQNSLTAHYTQVEELCMVYQELSQKAQVYVCSSSDFAEHNRRECWHDRKSWKWSGLLGVF